MLWTAAPGLADIHEFHVVLGQSGLMAWAETPYSYLAMTKESEYSEEDRLEVRAGKHKYLFVYPFEKKREWYRLPAEERMRIMREHIEIGRRYPQISINTTYSFGLDDQEFVVSFECDEPGDFLDLVHELRPSESSAYTLRDTPIFTCIASSVRHALDALDGEAPMTAASTDGNGLATARRPRSLLITANVHSDQELRVAIVGAGPAGFYAAGHLLAADAAASAWTCSTACRRRSGSCAPASRPDHPKIKSVVRVYEKTAAKEGFRFFGGVELGRDLHRADLLERYHAVIYAIGAAIDRRLGIPGEDLPGSEAATDFVGWYNGHPDYPDREFDLQLRAGRRRRQRQRRDRLRADARAERRGAAHDRLRRPCDRRAGLRRRQGDRDPRPPWAGAGGLHEPRAAGARRARAGGRDRRPGGRRAGRGLAGVARLRRGRQDVTRERADPARVRGARARPESRSGSCCGS